jgi:hypothetical protein
MSKLTIGKVLDHKEANTERPKRYWAGSIGPIDDWGVPITTAFIDGATIFGPWAIMTPSSHKKYGKGLGMGRGQRFEKQNDGRWLRVYE